MFNLVYSTYFQNEYSYKINVYFKRKCNISKLLLAGECKPEDFTVTIISSTALLPCFRNNGTKKTVCHEHFNLTDQNHFDKNIVFCSSFQQVVRVIRLIHCFTSPVCHLVSIPKCTTQYVQCSLGLVLRWQKNGWYRVNQLQLLVFIPQSVYMASTAKQKCKSWLCNNNKKNIHVLISRPL